LHKSDKRQEDLTDIQAALTHERKQNELLSRDAQNLQQKLQDLGPMLETKTQEIAELTLKLRNVKADLKDEQTKVSTLSEVLHTKEIHIQELEAQILIPPFSEDVLQPTLADEYNIEDLLMEKSALQAHQVVYGHQLDLLAHLLLRLP
jgi:DNA repair exonuclease SbcCD ATPase subunit